MTKLEVTLIHHRQTPGTADVGAASTGGRAPITPGALEMANVDLSNEFSNMIVTQRGFHAKLQNYNCIG